MTPLQSLFQEYLQARLTVCELRQVTLTDEIDSSATTWARRAEAIRERVRVMIEWCSLTTEMEGRRLLVETDLGALKEAAQQGMRYVR